MISERIGRGDGVRCLAAGAFQASVLAYVGLGWLALEAPGTALLAGAALLNLAGLLVAASARIPGLVRGLRPLVPLWNVAAWAGVIHLSGGVAVSPFVAGLGLEILLAVLVHRAAGVLAVAALAVVAVWLQELPRDLPQAYGALGVQSVLLGMIGLALTWVRLQWERRQEGLSALMRVEEGRLRAIEARLEDARTLAEVGERTARLGHGLKNAVHGLRGFAGLIERRLGEGGEGRVLLDGLHESIDRLESLAGETLDAGTGDRAGAIGPPDVRGVVEEAVADAERAHPGLVCRVACDGPLRAGVPRGVLAEVLENLLRNAAESMGGHGEVRVDVQARADGCEIRVHDTGPGIAPEMAPRLFRPGHTSKAGGHGMGLYLARRLIESHGGSITASTEGPGASFRIALPRAGEG